MLFAALLWAVMQYGIWRAVDAAAAQAFTGWVFAVGRLLFGMMAASFAALAITDADTRVPACPPHAGEAGQAVAPIARHGRPPRRPWPGPCAGPPARPVGAVGARAGRAVRPDRIRAGPILGAVLSVAAASGQPVRGTALLAVYAAGMTVPLLALAPGWDRLGIGHRRWLRGTGIRVGRLHLHTHSAISGLIFTGPGVVFLRYQGTAGLTGLLAPPSLDGWNNRLQDAVTAAQAHVPDLAPVAAVAAITARRLHRPANTPRARCNPQPSATVPATAHRRTPVPPVARCQWIAWRRARPSLLPA